MAYKSTDEMFDALGVGPRTRITYRCLGESQDTSMVARPVRIGSQYEATVINGVALDEYTILDRSAFHGKGPVFISEIEVLPQ